MPGDLEYLYLINPECQIITVKVSPPIDKIVASAQHSYIITLVSLISSGPDIKDIDSLIARLYKNIIN